MKYEISAIKNNGEIKTLPFESATNKTAIDTCRVILNEVSFDLFMINNKGEKELIFTTKGANEL